MKYLSCSQAIKLHEMGLRFKGALPNKQFDECNVPKTDDHQEAEDVLSNDEQVPALVVAPSQRHGITMDRQISHVGFIVVCINNKLTLKVCGYC